MNTTLTKTEETPAVAQASALNFLTPLANIHEDGEGYLLEAEMPGVGKDGIELTIENGELVILGHRAAMKQMGRVLYRESRGFDYRRAFELDPSIDSSKIVAKIEQGVLRLRLPKAEVVKPRKIKVD